MSHIPTEPLSNRTTVDASHFSLHLTSVKYLDFTEVFSQFWPEQEGNQAVERHSAIIWRIWKKIKNLGKWIIVRGISLFSATPGQSSNLKTNLEKMTKKNSIYLQRMRGKSSLASYRSFQTINKKIKKRIQPKSSFWTASSSPDRDPGEWFRRAGGLSPAWQLLPTTPSLCLFPGEHQASPRPSQGSHLAGCSANSQLKGWGRAEQAQSIMSLPRIISHLHKLWLGISWVMLLSSLALCLFHKCLQHISKPTSVSHTHPEVMISTACCLLAGGNIFFWASTLHLPPLGLVWRRTWTVTPHLLYSWLSQCLSHPCLIIPLPE